MSKRARITLDLAPEASAEPETQVASESAVAREPAADGSQQAAVSADPKASARPRPRQTPRPKPTERTAADADNTGGGMKEARAGAEGLWREDVTMTPTPPAAPSGGVSLGAILKVAVVGLVVVSAVIWLKRRP